MLFEAIRHVSSSLLPAGLRSGGSLELERCWPLNDSHLLLEYRDAAGRVLPGQWRLHSEALHRQAAGSANPPLLITVPTQQTLLLHPGGTDRRLRSLALLLRSRHSQLLSHRPGKRAIVRWQGQDPPIYCKLFTSQGAWSRAALGYALAFRHAAGYRAPRLQQLAAQSGCLFLEAVAGTDMHGLLSSASSHQGSARQIGVALRHLQAIPPEPGLDLHRAEDEAGLLASWVTQVHAYRPDLALVIAPHLPAVQAGLAAVADQPLVLTHRDLHDKQILIAAGEPPGFIDFDTVCLADPTLDLANLLAHLELRRFQDVCTAADCQLWRAGILDGYGVSAVPPALQAYLDSARLRLACVYAFRPRWQGVVAPLLARIGLPPAASWGGGIDPWAG